jgi:hypothetical protein
VIQHPVYSAGSPKVRVTVAGGCPLSLGDAEDVSNPGPDFWSELWHYSRLARSGAIRGLVCQYTLSSVERLPVPELQRRDVMTRAQASAVSAAAWGESRSHPGFGQTECPAEAEGAVSIVVLGYAAGPDADIWWNDSGCQTADNGHIQVDLAGPGVAGDDFPDAVDNVLPAQ